MERGFRVIVWLDGEPKAGDLGDSESAFIATVPTQKELALLIRMIGNFFAAEKGRPVKVSVQDLAGQWWCKPSGTIGPNLGETFAAYALETWTNCGDVRV